MWIVKVTPLYFPISKSLTFLSSDMFCKRQFMSVSVCEVRQTQWCSSVVCSQFPVLGLVKLLLYPQSKQLPRISGMTYISLLPHSLSSFFFNYCWSTYQVQKQSQDVLPLLPILYPDSSFLPCHCRKFRWDQEKANPLSCGEEYSLLAHLDSILFSLDVIFLSYCFAIKL